MLETDEDAVVCDLAETYHIYDWRSLPINLVATFVYGLGANSRIKRKLADEVFTVEEMLLANISDLLSILVWQNSKDGHKGINKPQLLTQKLSEKRNKNNSATLSFNSAEEFELARQALIRRDKDAR